MLVAGDKQVSATVTVGELPLPCNHSLVVDVPSECQGEAGPRWNKVVQVVHGAVFPEEGLRRIAAAVGTRFADHLTWKVDGEGAAAGVAPQCPQVVQPALAPAECMVLASESLALSARQVSIANNLAGVIHPSCRTGRPSKRVNWSNRNRFYS
jgi:hypothetical protein